MEIDLCYQIVYFLHSCNYYVVTMVFRVNSIPTKTYHGTILYDGLDNIVTLIFSFHPWYIYIIIQLYNFNNNFLCFLNDKTYIFIQKPFSLLHIMPLFVHLNLAKNYILRISFQCSIPKYSCISNNECFNNLTGQM